MIIGREVERVRLARTWSWGRWEPGIRPSGPSPWRSTKPNGSRRSRGPPSRRVAPASKAGGQGAAMSRSMSSPNGRSCSIGLTMPASQSSRTRLPAGGGGPDSAAAWKPASSSHAVTARA